MAKISIIGVPMDLGADRRGVDMGPSALRYADVNEKLTGLGYEVQDLGDIASPSTFPLSNFMTVHPSGLCSWSWNPRWKATFP